MAGGRSSVPARSFPLVPWPSGPTARPLAALLWHQTEEWVWLGSFLPWINRAVIGSDEDEFPIDRRIGFLINVVLGWGFSIAAITGPSAAAERSAPACDPESSRCAESFHRPTRRWVAPRMLATVGGKLGPRTRAENADRARFQGTRTTFPMLRRSAMKRCASGARSNEKVAATTGFSSPC